MLRGARGDYPAANKRGETAGCPAA